jgi:tripartite-type tricarboxylate transporter receptor subunit TctC
LSYTVPSVPLALFMEHWRQSSGADLVKVPFKGGGEAVNGVLSGTTPVAFFGLANWITHIRASTVKPLAVDGDARSPLLPEVPTLRELGYRGPLTRVYFGIVAPAGTSKPIVVKLRDEFTRIGSNPEFRQKRLVEQGLEPVFDTPEEFARFLKEDRARSENIVKEAGLVPQ